nr:beta-L-arabinofuranosidase domain-containing protein [Tessaracoccus coleopterorum]
MVQYAPATLNVGDVRLRVETGYPYDGTVRVIVERAPSPFALDLRIPAWAEGATVDGVAVTPGAFRVDGVTAGTRWCSPFRSARGSRAPTRGSTLCAARSPSSAAPWCCAPSRSTFPTT